MNNASTPNVTPKHKNKLGYIDPTVAGIDIGERLIHVSIPDGMGKTYVKEYGTTTPQLLEIAKDLKKAKVQTAVMEATGVYWIPLYEILEDHFFQSVLVDAKSVKNVPGRKSDVLDCQWIQTLFSNGLLRAAFRPPRDRVKLRSFTRTRMAIAKNRQQALRHIEKALQLMNIKLGTAVSDIAGVSGLNIIRAIVAGERNPVILATLRSQRCKKPKEVFVAALTGNFQDEHLFSLKMALEQYDFTQNQLIDCDKRILAQIETYPDLTETPPPPRDKDKKSDGKYRAATKPKKNSLTFDARPILWKKTGIDMTAIPGVEASTALLVFAELGGANVSSWNRVEEFSSWLKLCPGNNISGGKRRKSKKQPCKNYISQALRMCAMSAKNSNSAAGAFIRKVCGKSDKLKGIKAGAHRLARMLYFMCKNGWQYYEKGVEAYEKGHKERVIKSLQKKAAQLGFKLDPIAA